MLVLESERDPSRSFSGVSFWTTTDDAGILANARAFHVQAASDSHACNYDNDIGLLMSDTPLQEQLALYERQSQHWIPGDSESAHEKLLEHRHNLELLLKFGLFLLQQIQRIDEEWSADIVSAGGGGTLPESPQEIGNLYRWWCAPCARISADIELLSSRGYPVPGGTEFREACAAATVKARWDLSRIADAQREFSKGPGRDMEEVFDELQGRARKEGD
jgi:hypothetical protein